MTLDEAGRAMIVALVARIYDTSGKEAVAQRVHDALMRNGPPGVALAIWHQGAALRTVENPPPMSEYQLNEFCDEVELLADRVASGDTCLQPDLEFGLVIATAMLGLPFAYLSPVSGASSDPLQAEIDNFRSVRAMWSALPQGRRLATPPMGRVPIDS